MSRKNGEQGTSRPVWYEAGLAHVWLPYAQMKTVRAPLPVARTHGCRIVLCDGRELIDGIASWWTACHGYNHPYIRNAVEHQLALMPHVMFGGLAHERALTLACRLAACLPADLTRVFFSESRSEEHTSELQSPCNLVCRLLLEKKNKINLLLFSYKKKQKKLQDNI